MPRDPEVDKLLYGDAGPPGGKTGSTGKASAPASAGPGHVPSYDELDYQQKAGQGVAKFAAGAVTGIPRAINAGIGLVAPETSEKLGNLAERIPGVKRMEAFASSPSEGGWETAGNLGALGASMLINPTRALGMAEELPGTVNALSFPGRAAEPMVATKVTPVVNRIDEVAAAKGDLGKLAEIIGRPGPKVEPLPEIAKRPISGTQRTFPVMPPPSQLARLAAGAKLAGRGAAINAATGAATDPNDPAAGAVIGGLTGGLTPMVGKGLQTRVGKYVANLAARHGPFVAVEALAAHLGVPASWLWNTGFAQLFLWHSSPAGKWVGGLGERAAQKLGPALERSATTVPGAVSGSAESELEQ